MPEHQENHHKKLDRLNTFIDAILAIVMTLLVIELHLPELADKKSAPELLDKLSHMAPHLMAFLLCFLAVLQYWMGHATFQELIGKYSISYAVMSIVQMLTYCLLPFASSVIGEYPDNQGSYVLFGGLYLFGSILATFHMKLMWNQKLYADNVDLEMVKEKIMKYQYISPFIAAAMMFSGYISTTLAFVLFFSML
ncbi:MAG: TMEM175 family protein, partial [Bacteroidetes bacterium]|nr:TMEM175 family protein [Bacteroidota bacterium]